MGVTNYTEQQKKREFCYGIISVFEHLHCSNFL